MSIGEARREIVSGEARSSRRLDRRTTPPRASVAKTRWAYARTMRGIGVAAHLLDGALPAREVFAVRERREDARAGVEREVGVFAELELGAVHELRAEGEGIQAAAAQHERAAAGTAASAWRCVRCAGIARPSSTWAIAIRRSRGTSARAALLVKAWARTPSCSSAGAELLQATRRREEPRRRRSMAGDGKMRGPSKSRHHCKVITIGACLSHGVVRVDSRRKYEMRT